MSSLRNSIKKADPAPEKKEEIMLNLNLLFELATSKCDHFKTQIADNIRTILRKIGSPVSQADSEARVIPQRPRQVAAQGVVTTDMEAHFSRVEYADMKIAQVFYEAHTARDHKFAACTLRSGPAARSYTFPEGRAGVHPLLKSRFRLNAKRGAGQFEHTLIIVDEGASLHFIEGCSAPKYNVANLHAGVWSCM